MNELAVMLFVEKTVMVRYNNIQSGPTSLAVKVE